MLLGHDPRVDHAVVLGMVHLVCLPPLQLNSGISSRASCKPVHEARAQERTVSLDLCWTPILLNPWPLSTS